MRIYDESGIRISEYGKNIEVISDSIRGIELLYVSGYDDADKNIYGAINNGKKLIFYEISDSNVKTEYTPIGIPPFGEENEFFLNNGSLLKYIVYSGIQTGEISFRPVPITLDYISDIQDIVDDEKVYTIYSDTTGTMTVSGDAEISIDGLIFSDTVTVTDTDDPIYIKHVYTVPGDYSFTITTDDTFYFFRYFVVDSSKKNQKEYSVLITKNKTWDSGYDTGLKGNIDQNIDISSLITEDKNTINVMVRAVDSETGVSTLNQMPYESLNISNTFDTFLETPIVIDTDNENGILIAEIKNPNDIDCRLKIKYNGNTTYSMILAGDTDIYTIGSVPWRKNKNLEVSLIYDETESDTVSVPISGWWDDLLGDSVSDINVVSTLLSYDAPVEKEFNYGEVKIKIKNENMKIVYNDSILLENKGDNIYAYMDVVPGSIMPDDVDITDDPIQLIDDIIYFVAPGKKINSYIDPEENKWYIQLYSYYTNIDRPPKIYTKYIIDTDTDLYFAVKNNEPVLKYDATTIYFRGELISENVLPPPSIQDVVIGDFSIIQGENNVIWSFGGEEILRFNKDTGTISTSYAYQAQNPKSPVLSTGYPIVISGSKIHFYSSRSRVLTIDTTQKIINSVFAQSEQEIPNITTPISVLLSGDNMYFQTAIDNHHIVTYLNLSAVCESPVDYQYFKSSFVMNFN